MNESEFLSLPVTDKRTWFGICFSLAVVGEAIKNLLDINEDQYIEQYSEINWQAPYGLRNIIVHGYFMIDVKEIWNAIHGEQFDLLYEAVKKELHSA